MTLHPAERSRPRRRVPGYRRAGGGASFAESAEIRAVLGNAFKCIRLHYCANRCKW
jgi:hypothetical protein